MMDFLIATSEMRKARERNLPGWPEASWVGHHHLSSTVRDDAEL